MSVAILRYEGEIPATTEPAGPSLQRGDGAVEIAFAHNGPGNGHGTQIAHLYQRSPCRVLFPRPEPGDPKLAVLVTTSGGLAGGDRVRISASALENAEATITTQAAEKIYRSLGPDTRVETRLSVGARGFLEWLPQETILFDRARLDRLLSADVAPGGRLLAAEMLVFGRIARSEVFAHGALRDSWRVRQGEKLAWADSMALSGDITARLDAPLGFGGARALATAIYVGAEAPALLTLARELAEDMGESNHGGASLVGGVLVVRLLGARPDIVRAALARLLASLREAALGLPPRLPRLWAN